MKTRNRSVNRLTPSNIQVSSDNLLSLNEIVFAQMSHRNAKIYLNDALSDYLQIVDTPMDLMSVREDLRGGNYTTLPQFLQDMRLIFTNSRRYNTNARSRVSAPLY